MLILYILKIKPSINKLYKARFIIDILATISNT